MLPNIYSVHGCALRISAPDNYQFSVAMNDSKFSRYDFKYYAENTSPFILATTVCFQSDSSWLFNNQVKSQC